MQNRASRSFDPTPNYFEAAAAASIEVNLPISEAFRREVSPAKLLGTVAASVFFGTAMIAVDTVSNIFKKNSPEA